MSLGIGAMGRFFHRTSIDAVYPFEKAVTWFKRGVARRLGPFWKAQEIVSRVRDLEDEVARLRIDAALLEQVSAENRELRRRFQLPQRTLLRAERCTVLSRGGALGWWQSLRLDKGKRAGLREGDAVVVSEGLIGRIRSVTEFTSDVELITDPNSRIACVLELPEGVPSVRGILQGNGWSGENVVARRDLQRFLYVYDPLRLDYMKRNQQQGETFPPRTRVVTSGLSGTIPGGIFIGWLMGTELDSEGLYRHGKVLPAVDFAKIQTVFVLIRAGENG